MVIKFIYIYFYRHKEEILCLEFLGKYAILLSASADCSVCVWTL